MTFGVYEGPAGFQLGHKVALITTAKARTVRAGTKALAMLLSVVLVVLLSVLVLILGVLGVLSAVFVV